MAKIDELLKQKKELEKEIEKEKTKEIKLSAEDLTILTNFIGKLVIPPFLNNAFPESKKIKIKGGFFREENKGVITLENLNTKTKLLTITIKGE